MEAKKLLAVGLFLMVVDTGLCAPINGILVNHRTIRDLATYLHSSFHISGRDIQFSAPAGPHIKLIEVPLVGPAQQKSLTVRITLTLKPASGDSDPRIGLTDGAKQQMFSLMDTANYADHSPCYVHSEFGSHDNILVPRSTLPSAEYSFLFNPFLGYGSCSTAQIGGYVNTASFSQILDVRRGLTLIVYSDDDLESYSFKNILVELL